MSSLLFVLIANTRDDDHYDRTASGVSVSARTTPYGRVVPAGSVSFCARRPHRWAAGRRRPWAVVVEGPLADRLFCSCPGGVFRSFRERNRTGTTHGVSYTITNIVQIRSRHIAALFRFRSILEAITPDRAAVFFFLFSLCSVFVLFAPKSRRRSGRCPGGRRRGKKISAPNAARTARGLSASARVSPTSADGRSRPRPSRGRR